MAITHPTAALACLLLLLASPMLALATTDFYMLALMWPGAYCQQSKCCMPTTGPPANDFSIRGLWTYDSATGKPVTKCSSSPFYVKQIASVQEDLNAHWSNLKCPSNNGVGNWRKAWKQYGVCSGLEEVEYFKAALQLRAQLDVLSLLADKGIKPSLLYVYGVSQIKDAIKEGIGAAPLVRCSIGLLEQFQLYEIYVCVDKDGKTVIDCPVQPKYTCGEEVFFTPFYSGNLTSIPAGAPDGAADAHIEMVVSDHE